MDLHRLRVVGFDTSVREKEHEKKNNVQLEECKNEDRKISTVGNRDQIGDENQSLYDKTKPPELPKKYIEEISQQETSKNYLVDTPDEPVTSIKMDVNDEVTPPRTSKQCSGGKLRPPAMSKKYLNDTTSTSHLGTSKSQRSKSEIFKIPPKRKPRKRGLKINSSDIGLTKLFRNRSYSHQKKRTSNLLNRNRNVKKHHKEENIKKNIEDIHFLFARETPSFINYRRKRTEKERKKKTHDNQLNNDIFGFQKSNRTMIQSQISFLNFIDTDKLPFKKMRIGFRRKAKPPTPITNCYCKHHAMRVLNSACGNVGSRPIYYNLGTHPHPRTSHQKRDCDQEGFKRERSYCMAKDKTVEVSPSLFSPVRKSLRDAGTGSSKGELFTGSYHRPPRVLEKSTTIQNFTVANEYNQKPCPLPSTPSPCATYTALSQSPSCELKKSQTFQDVTRPDVDQKPSPKTSAPTPCALCAARTAPTQKKCKKKRKKTKKTFFPLTLCNEYFSRLEKLVTDFHSKSKISGKKCIKYVFFGLLIVVWSPCLLAVILAWVVMFPWKLTNILKPDVSKRSFPINRSFKNRLRKNNLRREYQRMCFENYLPEKKRSFVTLAANFFTRTVGVVVNSFNAVVSLLKFKKNVPMGTDSSFLPSSHPNPRKRYKLFYADNRGWVLKPLRRRTRSCASNRVMRSMRCEYNRPTFWQKSRGQNLKMTSLKKVPYPVQMTCSNLRHQCSPAGDACLVQNNGLWPSCVCWDKYSNLTKSKSLNSHSHRRQQVNIPSTFLNPTSGIAFISTDEKIIINPNKENNVSYKDLTKDYSGLRNNGTLPFKVVYPCRVKPPLTTNFETRRTHKFGLSGKTLNMSTKCTSSVLPKGLKGQFPKCWTKHNVGNALLKAPGVLRITSSRHITNSMPSCKLNRSQLRGQTTKILNCPYAGNQKFAMTNKNSGILQKNINFCNKSDLTNTLSRSTLTKQANTSTYKVSYAHKTQNTFKHITCQNVRNKSKTVKTKPDEASKCAYDAKRLPAKQEFKYKTKNHFITHKYSSTAKIKSSMKQNIILNYSFENKRKQSNQSYQYKPDLVPVATQMLLNTADITIMTNQNIVLNCSHGEKYAEFKHCHEHEPHRMSIETQKQLCTADITTSTNLEVALNCPCKENHELIIHGYKRKPNQIPVATQMLSTKADITTSTNRNVAVNCPCKENHGLSKHDHKLKPNKIPVTTQMKSRSADITTSTNRNVALNFPCEKKRTLPKYGYIHKPHHALVATQILSRTADITTSTNRNVALNYPCEEKHKFPKYGYTHKPHHTPVATQMQSRTAENATDTNSDLVLNGEKKFNFSQHGYKHKSHKITVATQMKSRTADNATDTKKLCIASTTDKESKFIQEINLSESNYIPGQIPVATQKQSNTVNITTMANCDTALNYPYKHEKSEHAYKCKPDQIPTTTQKQLSTADIIASTKYLDDITPSISNKDTLQACIPSTTGKDSASTPNSAPGYFSKSQDISIQKQSYKIDASVNYVSDYETTEIFHPEPILPPNKTVVYTDSTNSWKKTAPQKQTATFEKLIDGAWGDKRSRKILSALKRKIDTERPKRALPKKNIDCSCRTTRTTLKPIAIAAEFPIERQADENIFTQNPTKEPPSINSLKSSFVGRTLEVRRVSNTQPLSTRQLQMEDFIKQFQRHANSPSFGIASLCRYCLAPQVTEVSNLQADSHQFKIALGCRCRETPQQNERDKELKQKENNRKNTYTDKISSAKEPLNKQLKSTQTPSHPLQEETKLFVIASDCVCGTNKQVVAKRSLDKNILIKQPKVLKESRQHGSGTNTLKLTSDPHSLKTHIMNKSLPTSTDIQEMPCDYKCECNIVPSFKSKFPEHLPSARIPKINKTLTKFPKAREHIPSQMLARCPQFRIASVYRCGKSPKRNDRDKELKQRGHYSQDTYTHKSGSAEKPPKLFKQSNITEKSTRTLQEQSKTFRIASDCIYGSKQSTAAEKSLYKKVSSSKSTAAKEMKSKSPQHLPLSKSLPRKCWCKSLSRKCRYNSLSSKYRCPVESVQISGGKQYYGSNESLMSSKININKSRSQFPKSPERTRPSKSLLRKYRCPESLQNSEDKQPYSAKLSTLNSKRNVVKVDKTPPKLQTPPQNYFHHDCTCLVKSLQGPESKKTSERSRKSFFSRKSKRHSTNIVNEYPCTSSQNYFNKISFKSDVPVNWQTAKHSLIWSSGCTENTCSVNESSSRLQSSRISEYSSKVSSLVKGLRSKLFSRKSKQTKIFKQPTKKPPSVIFSSLQVTPKKVDKRDISINDILESILDVESNQSLFRRSHKSKPSQNPSSPLPLHSNHSSGTSVIHKSPLRQCTKKNRYKLKPTIVDKSYECLHNKESTVQRPSFLSNTSKYECRSHTTIVDPRVSQSIISRQSKRSKRSSIVMLFTRKSCSKLQSPTMKSSQKFDPQYSSSLRNCQQTPMKGQAMIQLKRLSGPNTLKTKCSFLFNQLETKPLVHKIGSISDKILANSHKKKQVNKSSTSKDKLNKEFDAISQQPKVIQRIPIIPGKCRCAREQKFTKEHILNIKQCQAIPQLLKIKKLKPIISGRYRCAENQNNTGENSSNKKLQPNTDLLNVTVIRPINNINLPPFRIVKPSKFSQHVANQALISTAAKQRHLCQQTGITLSKPLYNFQPLCRKLYKRRSFKYGNELEVPNSLHKVAKKRILHQSTNKFQKSHLISHCCSSFATTKRLREHIVVQKSDISRSAGIQPNLLFQIYQQNLPDQKCLIQNPTNVEKPSRKSLQQHSDAPGCAQKSTAEGEMRQSYPDFNRVSMRYPALNKTSLEQSLQIPGINSPPPSNNYPPAPGATPSPNYASDPCYPIPTCVMKPPYDESALRRAYKRRPLRHTPPRQQLPRCATIRQLKENRQRCAEAKRRKEKQQKQSFFQCLRQLVNKTEREVWPTDVKCHPVWLNAMKIKPCFCVYKVCPRMYPAVLNFRKSSRFIGRMFVYFFTLCFWSPFLFCAYLCCNVLCKCCA